MDTTMRQAMRRNWGLILLRGIAALVFGVLTLLWPGMTVLMLVLFIAAWAIVNGVMQVVAAIRLREEIEGEWLLVAGGLLSVLFGVALLLRPGEGAIAIALVISAFAIVYGVLLIAFAFRMRRHAGSARDGVFGSA
jgi:uncharacterized membrane protein HdeD (DUF308 family)